MCSEKPEGTASYEDWVKASKFARFRYKYGLIITLLAWLTMIILLITVFVYARELSTQPMIYTAQKYKIECLCFDYDNGISWAFNSTHAEYKSERGKHPLS